MPFTNLGRHRAPGWMTSTTSRRTPVRLTILGVMTALAVMVLSASWAGAADTSDSGVPPIEVAGNPNCAALNADNANFPSITSSFGFKVNQAPNGTFTLTNPPGELTGGALPDPGNSITIVNSDGTHFDWSSTLGIDAVIVKAGDSANVYVYTPEALEDGGLHGPELKDISHIEFCFDYELDVEKDANTTFTRTFGWTIDKSVDPDTWDLFTGDSGTSVYTVAVTKDNGTDSAWAVNGTITIENNTPVNATIVSVTDVISGFGAVTADCGVTFPHVLAAGGTLECDYSTALPNGTSRTNTATVTTSGGVGGGSDDAAVTFGTPTTLVNDTINVEDQFEDEDPVDLGEFDETGSTTYPRTFTCDGDEGQHDNTATIVETGQSDDASVTVTCHELEVTKDAATSLTRTWTWTIVKEGDATELTLSEGQLHTVNYDVTVDASSADSVWAVTGNIAVENPAPIDATINTVADIISPDIAADVDCEVDDEDVIFPYTLPAEETLNCTYSANLPDDDDRTNTATAALQNYDYAFNEDVDEDEPPVIEGTPSGTTDFSGTASVSFANATVTEIDECVDVTDTNAVSDANPTGLLGEVCADDAPETFEYSLTFGMHPDADVVLACGENTHVNTAVFETNDTETTDDDDWTVIADVTCGGGCTLTPGYWKTHSAEGPAPFDDTWNALANGEDTPFFGSGKTYYQALWTAPGGNAYYILAHAYIAAQLNILNGASVPANVQTAFNTATGLFGTHTPAQIAALRGNSPIRAQFISLAGILDGYNNGLSGPGHCSEQT